MRLELSVANPTSPMARLRVQASALAFVAGLGGCSSMFNFDEPLFTGSTANQKEIISGDTAAASAPSGSIRQADLLPPPGGQTTPNTQPTASAPEPYVPPKPYAASGLPTPLGKWRGFPRRRLPKS